jgi:hypothetical protein
MGAESNSFTRIGYVPSSNPNAKILQEGDEHTNQHHRNDPIEVMNAAEKMGSIEHPVGKIWLKH